MRSPIILFVATILAISTVDIPEYAVSSTQNNNIEPSLAILDTAINSDLSVFDNNIIHEVCVLEWNSCPNGKKFMEGRGAASMPISFMIDNGFDHGTKMAHAAIKANPDVNIVFIRVIGSTVLGQRKNTTEAGAAEAFKWIIKNKEKFNIQAVAMSQGNHDLNYKKQYCPNRPATNGVIKSLLALDVPVFFSAGNDMDYKRVSWPACIKESIAVSATASTGSNMSATYSNYDSKLTDFFAPGMLSVVGPTGNESYEFGTSISTQIVASVYIGIKSKFRKYDSSTIFDLMIEHGKRLTDKQSNARIVDRYTLNDVISGH